MLNEAIRELYADLAKGADVAETLAEIAEDYGLNPALLRRKFAEQYGFEPEAARGVAEERGLAAARAEEAVERAIENAVEKYRGSFHGGSEEAAKFVGRRFENRGRKFRHVAVTLKGSGLVIHAIRESDCEEVYWDNLPASYVEQHLARLA